MMRRRRPLMRAAMVGGAAYAVGKHAQRGDNREDDQEMRLQQLEAQQTQQYAQAPVAVPPGGGPTDIAEKLTQLKSLQDQGVLTPEEFAAAKAKLLAG
jgi:Short C-terminal domain